MVARVEGETALNRLLREEGVTLARFNPTGPLSFASMSSVFERAARMTGDETFGFRVGMGMVPEDYGPFVDYAMSAPVLSRALRRVSATSLFQTNAVALTIHEEGDTAVWNLSYQTGNSLARHQHALHILPAMVRSLRQYLGEMVATRAAGLSLDVALPTRTGAAVLEDTLGLPVRHDADRYAVLFPKAWLASGPIRVRKSNLTFCDVYHRYMPQLPRSTAEAVTLLLEPILAEGTIHIDEVARKLGISRRKLQSDLNGEGHIFRDLLRSLRAQRAMRLMRETSDTLAEIALGVGYSDQAHFHRAFSAVAGMAPGEWRSRRRTQSN